MTMYSTLSLIGAFAVFGAFADDEASYPYAHEFEHLELLNQLRAEGFTCPGGNVYEPNDTPLLWDCALWRASRGHSEDMAGNDFFEHESPTTGSPGDRAREQGTTFSSENIAAGNSMPADTLEQWKRSRGHCNGMMDPARRSMAVGFAMDVDASYWFYWTQMSSNSLPLPEHQDCINESGGIPQPLPSPPPTNFPTTDSNMQDDMLDMSIQSYEMQVLDIINRYRKEGNSEECSGKFYTNLPPLEWNCALFRAARVHMNECVTNEKWARTINGVAIKDRTVAEGVPDTCSSFMLSNYYTPERFVARLAQMACWAVYGERYKSFGVALYRNYWNTPGMPSGDAWIPIFNKYPASYTPELQTCGGVGSNPAPVAQPTPAPTDAPTAEPTDAPTDTPTDAPTDAPTAPPTEASVALGDCGDYAEKKECKADAACCWKSDRCKSKAKLCPKQKKEKKCTKLGCFWDSEGEACSVEEGSSQ